MPTRRSPLRRGRASGGAPRITRQAVSCFKIALALQDDPARKDDFVAACHTLDHLTGRWAPWLQSVMDVEPDATVPVWMKHPAHVADWKETVAVRNALEEAAAEQGNA